MRNGNYLIWDIGTGDLRAAVVNRRRGLIRVLQEEWSFPPDSRHYLTAGLDPGALRSRLFVLGREVVRQTDMDIEALAVTSQRVNIVLFDGSGTPIFGIPNVGTLTTHASGGPTIDENTACTWYKQSGRWLSEMAPTVRLRQLLKAAPDLANQVAGMASISDWWAYELTGVWRHEITQAAETLLYNILEKNWNPEAALRLEIPFEWLQPLSRAGEIQGFLTAGAAKTLGLQEHIPVVTVSGDTQMAVHAVTDLPGDVVVVAGTTTPVVQLLDSPCWDPLGRTWTDPYIGNHAFLLESNAGVTGLNYQWVRRTFYGSLAYDAIEAEVSTVQRPGVLGYLGADVMDGRRGFHQRPGMMWFSRPPTLGQVERRDLAWAALWDHACAIASNIAQLERVSNVAPARVLGVGGGFRSRTFARLVADFTGRPIVISSDGADATVLGAARVVSSALGTPMAPYESSTTVIPDPPEVIAQYPGVDVWLAGSKWLTDAPIPVS